MVHAYSHVNTFSSAAMVYAVTGDERYLRICTNAYDYVQNTQCYATGGFGPAEYLVPPDGTLGGFLEHCSNNAEIPCGSWAGFKLSRYLIGFTGEARYGDWIETLLYNGIGSALPTLLDGSTFYYADYRVSGGTRLYYWEGWPCCAGTYIQSVVDYHNIIYLKGTDGLYTNLFVPSEVAWNQGGESVVLRQETDYPESEITTLSLKMARPVRFGLRFRVPGWSQGASVSLNGSALAVPTQPGRWATIEREWQPGDQVTIRIPLELRLKPVDEQHPRRVAVTYGPLEMVQEFGLSNPRPFALEKGAELTSALVREEIGPNSRNAPAIAGLPPFFGRVPTDPGLRFRIVDTQGEPRSRFLRPLYANRSAGAIGPTSTSTRDRRSSARQPSGDRDKLSCP